MSLRAKPRAKQEAQGQKEGPKRTATVCVSSLEIARGYDGVFRGTPEPALLLGLFECGPDSIRLLDRCLLRFEVAGKVPGVYEPQAANRAARRVTGRIDHERTFSLVVMAVEEDSGAGLSHLYGLLERPEALSFWRSTTDIPEVRELATLAADITLPGAREAMVLSVASLLADATDVSELAQGDDFVGAAVGHYAAKIQAKGGLRATFTSADSKNSWTAVLDLTVR